ncbi:MAG: polymer-forming cytoskeletal protein [Spirochaetes bacterium]|nr:polymer-forming cytoskeletal protein [Spirochaetota bacterium]
MFKLNKKSIISIFYITGLLFFLSGSLPASERVGFGHSIEIKKNETVDTAVSIGGNVTVLGKVKEDVVSIGGSIVISGKVDKDVVAIGGNVELKPTARITGKIVAIGGEILKSPKAVAAGGIINMPFRKVFSFIWPYAKFTAKWSIHMMILFTAIRILLMIALFVLIVLLFQKSIDRMQSVLEKQWVRSGLFGFLTLIGVPVLSFLLLVTIIGIVLIPVVIIAVVIAYLLGRVCIAYLVGKKLQVAIKKKDGSPVTAVICGELLLSLVSLIPFLGIILKAVIIFIAIGLTVVTGFGTHEPIKKK